MLRRRTGIYLLTLLVITGLAGTINSTALSGSQRKYATGIMKDAYKDAARLTKGLSKTQLNYKPGTGQWSLKDYVYHLAAVEKAWWQLFQKTMKSPPNPENRVDMRYTDADMAQLINTASASPEPVETPRHTYKNLDDALADFKATRNEHIKYMKSSTEDLRNHVVELPCGWVDCYQLYLLMAEHSNRHLREMMLLKTSQHFPH